MTDLLPPNTRTGKRQQLGTALLVPGSYRVMDSSGLVLRSEADAFPGC